MGRYLLELNGRYDGSSQFPENDQWAFFPSASAGWRFTEESFMESTKSWLSNGKLRASYGSIGNQVVGNYMFLETMSKVNNGVNWLGTGDSKYDYFGMPKMVPSTLTWETINTTNIGLDLGFLQGELNVNLDWFQRDTKDMLAPGKELPSVLGTSAAYGNEGSLRSRGWEITIDYRHKFGDVNFYGTFNISDYKTKVTDWDSNNLINGYYTGKEYGEIWGFKTDGFFKTTEEAQAYAKEVDLSYSTGRLTGGWQAGDLKFVDLDGNGVWGVGNDTVDKPGDRTILGNSLPTLSYGINASIRWMGFDASVFFQGTGNHYWYPHGEMMPFWGCYSYPYLSYLPTDFLGKVWAEDNPDSYFPRARAYSSSGGYLSKVNDRYLQNIRYLRLKNLTVGYTIPATLTKKAGIDQIRIYFSGENLCYWSPLKKNSKYVDPEAAINRSGVNNNAYYPWAKTFMFGIDITF